MATKSAAKRVAEAALMAMGPAQGELLAVPPQPGVVYTGKPGRPKGRKNDKTLLAEANIANIGERAFRGTLKTAVDEPEDEARRILCKIWRLSPDTPPDHVVTRKLQRTEKDIFGREVEVYRAVTLGELIEAHTFGKCIDDRKNARAIAMPFVQQKKPQQIDVTEKHLVTIVQKGMDDDGLGDAAAKAKNVTPAKAPATVDHEDGL